MGAIESTQARQSNHFKSIKKHCEKWRIQDVTAARQRFADIYKEYGSFLIGRRQFWEIFTDYDVSLVKGGEFLSIPVRVFNYFMESSDSEVIDVREIFCLAVLFAQGSVISARLEVCFPLFGPSMTEEHVVQVLTVFQKAFFHLDVIHDRMSTTKLASLVTKLFAEGSWRKCYTISSQMLVDWLFIAEEFSEIIGFLFDAKMRATVNSNSMLQNAKKTKKATSVLRNEVKKLLVLSESTLLQKKNPKKSDKADGKSGHRDSTLQHQIAIRREGSIRRVNSMRNEVACTTAEAADTIVKMKLHELEQLRGTWCDVKAHKSGLLVEQFTTWFYDNLPKLANRTVTRQLFDMLDTNKDLYLDFPDFCAGVLKLAPAHVEDKVLFLFTYTTCIYNAKQAATVDETPETEADADHLAAEQSNKLGDDGADSLAENDMTMKVSELIRLIQISNSSMADCARFVEVIFTIIDFDKNGVVDRDEFLRGTKEMPQILASFDECLLPREEFKSHVRRLNKKYPMFNPRAILRLWCELQKRKPEFRVVDWVHFLKFTESLWTLGGLSPLNTFKLLVDAGLEDSSPAPKKQNSNEKEKKHINFTAPNIDAGEEELYRLLFKVYSSCPIHNTSNNIDLRKSIIHIMLALTDPIYFSGPTAPRFSPEEKALLYFELFDVDNSDSVDYNEFFELLYSSQLDAQDVSWRTVEALRQFEEKNGARITMQALFRLMMEQETVLEGFARVLCASTSFDTVTESLEDAVEEETVDEGLSLVTFASQEQISAKDSLTLLKMGSLSKLLPGSMMPELPLKNSYNTSYEFAKSRDNKSQAGSPRAGAVTTHQQSSLSTKSKSKLSMH